MFAIVTVFAAALVDLFRSRRSLLTEIALLRHQLTLLERSVVRPRVTRLDRIVLVALAAITPTWRNVRNGTPEFRKACRPPLAPGRRGSG
jgi:hypothetical protein